MADFSTLIATLRATIKTNYNQEITGQILQDDLLAMVDAVNRLKQDTLEGYAFYGAPLANGASVAVTQNTFFLVGKGTYTINGTTETTGEGISALVYDSVNDEVRNYSLFVYDTTPTQNSKNAITSGAVHTALAPLATKEEVEAVEQEVAQIAGEAGLAEAVIDTDGAGTEQEFTFRKSGGDGGAYYRKIKGKTIVVDDQLASNDAAAVETTGVNQWDEEWVNGYWDNSGFHADARFICSKNKIKVIPGETYFFRGPNIAFGVIGYDAEGDYVQYIGAAISNSQFIIPAGISYITFNPTNVEALTTYNHDICINLSNPAINGQYFPYWKRTLQLGLTTKKDTDGNVPFADGMKGAGMASDWADKVGGEKRMGRVDLGGLNYTNESGSFGAGAFSAYLPSNAHGGNSNTNEKSNIIASGYANVAMNDIANQDKSVALWGTSINLIVKNSAFAGYAGEQVAAALSGVMLDYELATPVPFTWAEPLNLGVKVDENGTERAVAPEGATAPSAPFVADTTYTMSVARMVEKLRNL